jgi:omega-6 fatty acid desaturase / acyl-lipid omega-6 desaturase (Delta-12 desaturase)
MGYHLFHGIVKTHVLHHYISTISFYHADKAMQAIKFIMKGHYRSDTGGGNLGFIKRVYSNVRKCREVERSEDAKGEGKQILFFRTRIISVCQRRK